jgi:hypothetical protein
MHNAFVQCFASRGPVRRTAFKRLETMGWQEMNEAFWDFFMDLQNQFVDKQTEVLIMGKQKVVTPETIMESGKQLRKSLLAVLTPEERLAGLTTEELVSLMAQIEAYLQKQQRTGHPTTDKANSG